MINTLNFIDRLKKIMEYHQLTASNFADTIGVQRSSISHILSGRNKPSLDFILKIINQFTEVDLYWLLKGEGNFPKKKTPLPPPISSEISTSTSINEILTEKKSVQEIERIIVFYKDGTFKAYNS